MSEVSRETLCWIEDKSKGHKLEKMSRSPRKHKCRRASVGLVGIVGANQPAADSGKVSARSEATEKIASQKRALTRIGMAIR